MAKTDLTAQRLRELLHYDPEAGVFTWRVDRSIKTKAGAVAGGPMVRGDHAICIDFRKHKTHRLAWLYMTGEWPKHEIDHRDTDALNNRWENLREATSAQNKQNLRKAKGRNRCGVLGVYLHGQNKLGADRWRARIRVDGTTVHLGLFDSAELAHAAYVSAKRRLHPFGTL